MPYGKILKYVNLSIAVLLVGILVAIYQIAYRPLPETSGQIDAPIKQSARVVRDALGVPHIDAASWEDAVFLQGYVTAQDRLWQMDALRRLAAGELSEIVGAAALEVDRDARHLRMRRIAEEQYKTLSPKDLAVLSAYARGVNYFIETHLGRLPLEFTLLRYDPRPWAVTDSILAGLQMYRNLTTTWEEELQEQNLLQGGDAAKVNLMFSTRSGREFQPGSNAFVISGAHTASGKPLLANDPHLDFAVPATWYMVHLKAPDLDVSGVSLPGVPCVIVGHNRRIAWGVTNLGYDVQDLYSERMNLQTGAYEFQGHVEQARLERETIAVKDAQPVEFNQWVTRHGPVAATKDGRKLALRWAAAEPASFEFPFLQINQARNWKEFTAGIARFPGPGQNFVYADVDGNIGYHATGKLPVRRNYAGDVPTDGSTGASEWEGFIPFDQLPTFFNPPAGYIVTANQNPFPVDYAYAVHGDFAAPYRSRQIRDLLRAKEGWKPQDILAVQKDVYSAFMHFLAGRVVAAYDAKHPSDAALGDAVALLRPWSGQMEKGTAAPLIATLCYQQLKKRVAESASPGKGALYSVQMAPAVIQNILAEGGRGWFADINAELLASLSEGLKEGAQTQGTNLPRWDWGKYNELMIRQPVGGRLPLVGGYFNIGPTPMSGASTTVKQTTRTLGPSMRMIADLSAWDESLNNITVGESGQILSAHYKDQWEAYYSGRSFPMQFERVDAKEVLVVKAK